MLISTGTMSTAWFSVQRVGAGGLIACIPIPAFGADFLDALFASNPTPAVVTGTYIVYARTGVVADDRGFHVDAGTGFAVGTLVGAHTCTGAIGWETIGTVAYIEGIGVIGYTTGVIASCTVPTRSTNTSLSTHECTMRGGPLSILCQLTSLELTYTAGVGTGTGTCAVDTVDVVAGAMTTTYLTTSIETGRSGNIGRGTLMGAACFDGTLIGRAIPTVVAFAIPGGGVAGSMSTALHAIGKAIVRELTFDTGPRDVACTLQWTTPTRAMIGTLVRERITAVVHPCGTHHTRMCSIAHTKVVHAHTAARTVGARGMRATGAGLTQVTGPAFAAHTRTARAGTMVIALSTARIHAGVQGLAVVATVLWRTATAKGALVATTETVRTRIGAAVALTGTMATAQYTGGGVVACGVGTIGIHRTYRVARLPTSIEFACVARETRETGTGPRREVAAVVA